jgi:hypothetical protein
MAQSENRFVALVVNMGEGFDNSVRERSLNSLDRPRREGRDYSPRMILRPSSVRRLGAITCESKSARSTRQRRRSFVRDRTVDNFLKITQSKLRNEAAFLCTSSKGFSCSAAVCQLIALDDKAVQLEARHCANRCFRDL